MVKVSVVSRVWRARANTWTGRYGGSIAIDGAIGALGGLDQMLAQGEMTLHAQIHNAIQRQ